MGTQIRRLLVQEPDRWKIVFLIFIALNLGLGLFLTASRGGIVSSGASLVVMSLLLIFKADYRKVGVLLLFFGVLTLAFGIYFGMEYTVERFEKTGPQMASRLTIYRSAWPNS